MRDAEERIVHPLYQHARDALNTVLDDLRTAGQFPEIADPAVEEFVTHSMTLTAKSPAPSAPSPPAFSPDPAHTIALLKRALAAANAIAESPLLPTPRLTHYRSELMAVREELLALIQRLRG